MGKGSKERIEKCHICDGKISVNTKVHNSNPYLNRSNCKSNKGKRTFSYSDSKEGVLFVYNTIFFWFCNECWDAIIDYHKSK